MIYEGDCLEVMKDLPDDSVDLIVTDPPYFLPFQSYSGKRGDGYKRTLADASILKFYFENLFKELDRIIKPSGVYYVFCDAQSYPIFYQVMFPYVKHVRLLIWDKKVSYNGYTWRHQHELIAWGEKKDTKRIPTGDGDIIKCRGVLQKDRLHPAEKPVELMEILIKKHGEGLTVFDPYSGSGSVGVAAIKQNCNFIGIEFDLDHCTTIKKRLGEVTNQTRLPV